MNTDNRYVSREISSESGARRRPRAQQAAGWVKAIPYNPR
jgi:hypothetical protein